VFGNATPVVYNQNRLAQEEQDENGHIAARESIAHESWPRGNAGRVKGVPPGRSAASAVSLRYVGETARVDRGRLRRQWPVPLRSFCRYRGGNRGELRVEKPVVANLLRPRRHIMKPKPDHADELRIVAFATARFRLATNDRTLIRAPSDVRTVRRLGGDVEEQTFDTNANMWRAGANCSTLSHCVLLSDAPAKFNGPRVGTTDHSSCVR
jgi:hypothetical protein